MESGIFHTTYQSDQGLRRTPIERWRLYIGVVFIIGFPLIFQSNNYYLLLANQCMVAAIGAIGLNILTGYTGQISLGQGAFMAVGAYTSATLAAYHGVYWMLAIPIGAIAAAVFGVIFGIPSLRLKGLYLAIATLAAQEIVEWFITKFNFKALQLNGEAAAITVPTPRITIQGVVDIRLRDNFSFYWVILICLLVVIWFASNLFRTKYGRAFVAIRDQDIAAEVMGVNPFRTKLLAFAISSFIVGLAGSLSAFYNARIVTWESFTVNVSITYLAMIIIGGLGSITGSIYGAVFMTLLPAVLTSIGQGLSTSIPGLAGVLPYIQQGVFGLVIVLFLIVESHGLARIWRNIKDYFHLWPFSY
jgi:branched-chain amino acid transport system permease protein